VTDGTRQLADPAGTAAAHASTVALTVAASLYGLGATTVAMFDGAALEPLFAALAALAIASTIVGVAASPFRSPFRARSHLAAQAAVVLSGGLMCWATWGRPEAMWYDGWPALSAGMLLLAVSHYRPVREIVAAATLVGVLLAALVLLRLELAGDRTAVVTAISTLVAVTALGYGAAAYTSEWLQQLRRRRRRVEVSDDALAREQLDGVARIVHHDRVGILTSEVAPFFARVLAAPAITAADREEARRIADSIRHTMVTASDRTWLESMAGECPAESGMEVSDADGLAADMSADQRTALRTLLTALCDDRAVGAVTVTMSRVGERRAGVVTAGIDVAETSFRADVSPWFAVMQAAFSTASLDIDHPHLIVRFDYARR